MRQNCCASLAKKWEIAGIKAVQLSCVYGVPIISDSGRKDSVTLSRTTKTRQRCWSSCACVYNSHTVGAVTAINSHLTVTNAHIWGQKIMTTDYDCYRDHSKLKLIADRKKAGHQDINSASNWSFFGGMLTPFFGKITSFAILLMRRKSFPGHCSWVSGCVQLSRASMTECFGEWRHLCPFPSGWTGLTTLWI